MGYRWMPGLFAILDGVEPDEVMQVLDGPDRRWPRPTTGPRGLPMLALLGRARTGRPIVVYVRHDQGLDWEIIAARPMTAGEADEFDRWEARQ
jgi:hypothetical protein